MKTLQVFLKSFLAVLGIPYGLLLAFLVFANLQKALRIPTHVPGISWHQVAIFLFSGVLSALFVIVTWKAVLRRIGEQQPAPVLLITIALFSALALGFLSPTRSLGLASGLVLFYAYTVTTTAIMRPGFLPNLPLYLYYYLFAFVWLASSLHWRRKG